MLAVKKLNLLRSLGEEVPTNERISITFVNGSMAYEIVGGIHDERDFDTYRPTLQKMLDSLQLGVQQ